MISTAPSSPAPTRVDLSRRLLLAVVLGMLALGAAQAKQGDRSQPVKVDANHFDSGAKPNGVTHLVGNVVITQGTLKATSDKATVYLDDHSQVKRVVLTGHAHIKQMDDHGNLMTGQADSIDYDVPGGVATLTGQARVQQAGRGSASGETLVYNTRTSTMSAQGSNDNRVHLVFKARQQPAAASSAPAAPGKGN